ncbi:hypothetical protein GCM10010195_40450 [Kitasatospora griseola]|nr:hypothetical protein GCM10010195_40450 [Kitasatospora griseola]
MSSPRATSKRAAALVRGAVQEQGLGGPDEFGGTEFDGSEEARRKPTGGVFGVRRMLPTSAHPFTVANAARYSSATVTAWRRHSSTVAAWLARWFDRW